MARVRWHEYETVYQGDIPVLEFLFTKKDGQTVVDLTGYAGWVTFWYPDALPHRIRAAVVDGTNGIVRYFSVGDEFPTVSDVLFQATVQVVDLNLGTDKAWFEISHPVVRWRVLPRV
jgi:hypothetical protein